MGLFTIGKDEPIPDIRPHMNLKVISCILEEVTNMLLLTFEDQSWIEISPDNSEYEAYIISSKFGFWEYFYPH